MLSIILWLTFASGVISQDTCLSYKSCLSNCISKCDNSGIDFTNVGVGRIGKAGPKGETGGRGEKGEPGICSCDVQKSTFDRIRAFACQLGIRSGVIPDSALSSSSFWDANHGANHGRLDKFPDTTIAGWCSKSNAVGEWIQVDFGVAIHVTGVITQGRKEYTPSEWVTQFTVKYQDREGNWRDIVEHGEIKVFIGNEDRDTWKVNYFPNAVEAKIIRIVVVEWVTHICMRFEVLGC